MPQIKLVTVCHNIYKHYRVASFQNVGRTKGSELDLFVIYTGSGHEGRDANETFENVVI